MLKDICRFDEIDKVVLSAKRICRFFYNHGRLHAEMKAKIGGELVRPNAMRFGTVFIFLESFWDRKDKFQQWVVSEEWKNNECVDDPDYDYAGDCLTSRTWWNEVKWVIDAVKPLYGVLRFADQQKEGTISCFLPTMKNAMCEWEALFYDSIGDLNRFFAVVKRRTYYLCKNTLMYAACLLDPESNYKYGISDNSTYMKELTLTVERIADSPEEAVEALAEFEMFHAHRGMFDGGTTRIAATRMTPTTWWRTYGGDVKVLQKYALRIVSQCVSSSGCERNWSTFALIHTKVRNRLSYAKLHKLVYVHYNLKLRLQQMEEDRQEPELDASGMLMETTLFDSKNPIIDWLSKSISEYEPTVDEGVVPPKPSKAVNEKSSDAILDKPINLWASKRKHPNCARKEKNKKGKKAVVDEEEDIVGSDDDTETPPNSLDYAESQDSSSPEDDGGNDDNDDGSDGKGAERGGQQYVQATESQAVNLPLRFTEEDHFTHATQDADHGSRLSRVAKKKDLSSLY